MSKEQWDERYRNTEYVYGKEPNGFFRRELHDLAPGKLLLPAEGEGRNAVFAASEGWDVTAFDHSEEGKQKAMKLAHEKGVSFHYGIATLEEASFPENHFDAVALIFIHQPPLLRRAFHRRLLRFLKPGGVILMEAYSREQIHFLTGGPLNPDLLFTEEDIREDFNHWEIICLKTMLVNHDEGLLHRGIGSVIRLKALKPFTQ